MEVRTGAARHRPRAAIPPPARLGLGHGALVRSLADLRMNRAVRVAAAARSFVELTTAFARAGGNVVQAALGDEAAAEAWRHYPAAGRPDAEAASSYYYHCHDPRDGRHRAEHGHFHLFAPVRAAGGARGYAHLFAIGVDAHGLPRRLFTTNRWVTDETWLPAGQLARYVERYRLDGEAPLTRWLEAVAGTFQPQILALLERRDARFAALTQRRPAHAVLEDRRIETLSEVEVSIQRQVAAIEAAAAIRKTIPKREEKR